MWCTYIGMGEGTIPIVLGDGGTLIGPRGGGEQAEKQVDRKSYFFKILF